MRNIRTRPAKICPSEMLRAIAQLSQEVEELKRQVMSAEQAQGMSETTKSHRHARAEDFKVAPASRRSLTHH
jgi:hypothetical protein